MGRKHLDEPDGRLFILSAKRSALSIAHQNGAPIKKFSVLFCYNFGRNII